MAGEDEREIQEEAAASGEAILIYDGMVQIADGLKAIAASLNKLADSQSLDEDAPRGEFDMAGRKIK